MRRFFKACTILTISALTLMAGVCTKQNMVTAQASEYTAGEMVFLEYCDPKALAEWDENIDVLTEEHKSVIKSYMDTYIISGVEDDYQKAQLIFNWIVNNIEYNFDNVGASPYAVFTSKTAVCGGYSNLYKAMLNLADIPAVVLLGNTPSGGHAWNAVYVDGRWFYADSTWGNGWFDVNETDFNLYHETTRMESAKVVTKDGLILGFDRGLAVVGVSENVKDVVVPDTYEGLDIVAVSFQLFADQYGVKSVTVGKNIRLLDTQMASKTLESITVSNDNEMYYSEDGVLFSKDKSQILCYPPQKKSENFIMPKETVNFDEKETFSNEFLININVEKENPQYSSYDGALYNKDQTELLVIAAGKKEITIPETAKISYSAFANVDVSEITVYAKKSSPAYEFAVENQIKVVDITNGMPTPTEEVTPTETPEVKDDVTTVFDDVYTDWYIEYVQYVYDNNLMTGIKGTKHFAPNANITKAQVAQVLYNMEGQPSVTDQKVFGELQDVYAAEWYVNAVAWAYNNNIVTGDLNTKQFQPNADVTREQLALMMFRYAAYKKMDLSATSNLEGLKNAENVNNWAADGVKWAVGSGLISGVEKDGVKDLAPQGNATRAQVAAILQRFCEK